MPRVVDGGAEPGEQHLHGALHPRDVPQALGGRDLPLPGRRLGLPRRLREAEEEVVEWAVELVFPKLSGNGGPALIEGAGGNDVSPEGFAGTAWEVSGIGEI